MRSLYYTYNINERQREEYEDNDQNHAQTLENSQSLAMVIDYAKYSIT